MEFLRRGKDEDRTLLITPLTQPSFVLHCRVDQREHLYTREQFEQSKTHDELWNAAQSQMVHLGKMHGFMRMYWAKKILEWTSGPEEAIQV